MARKNLKEKKVSYTDEFGITRRKSFYGKTQREADQKALDFLVEVKAGLDPDAPQKFAHWCEVYKTDYENGHFEGPNLDRELRNIHFWKEEFGDKNIADIKPSQISTYLSKLAKCNPRTGKPMAKDTFDKYFRTGFKIFKKAVGDKAITKNPFEYIKKPAILPPPKDVPPLTEEQRIKLNHTPGECQLACMVMTYAGLSPAEAMALTWADIYFDEGAIFVNKSAISHKGNRGISTYGNGENKLKCRERVRWVFPLPPLMDYLKEVYESGERDKKYILFNTDVPISKDMFDTYMDQYNKAMGLEANPFNRYQCRHYFATTLDDLGCTAYTVRRQMGHSTPADDVTHRNYVSRKKERDLREMAEIREKFVRMSYDLSYTLGTSHN